MLAAVINRPAHFNPLKHPERARQRRNLVLDLMAQQRYLTRQEAARWKEEPLPESRADRRCGQIAPYFVEWVRRTLEERFGSDLYSKGYRVYTSLDVQMQSTPRRPWSEGGGWSGQPGSAARAAVSPSRNGWPTSRAHTTCREPSSPWTPSRGRSRRSSAAGTSAIPSSTGDPGEAPAGVGLQAVRLHGRHRQRGPRVPHHPGRAHQRGPAGRHRVVAAQLHQRLPG
jgi:hypothetical protein